MGDLKQLRRTTGAALCLECGKCSAMCPLASYGGFSAARTMSMHDPKSEIHRYADAVERCLTCGSCEIRCPQGVKYTEYVRGLRVDVPVQHRRPRPHGEVFQIASRLSGEGKESSRPAWLEDDQVVSEEGDTALFVGCLPLFDVVFGEAFEMETVASARSAIRLLNGVGISPVLVGGECCCGHDLLWGGEREAFETLARANCECFKSRGIQRVLTVCAECCRTWRLDYPKVVPDYQPKVEHLAEFLASRVEQQDLVFRDSGNGSVTFQDPCRLGRHLGIVDEPRRLLEAVPGALLVEMDRSGRDAQCCGTSGFIHCDAVSRQLQAKRLVHAAETGATKLLTACPKCLLHFRCAQVEDRRRGLPESKLEVEDLIVYLGNRMVAPEHSSNPVGASELQTGEQS